MIIGIISLFLDLLLLNKLNYVRYSSLVFPMFTFVYIISRIYLKKDNRITIFFSVLLMSIYGYFFYIIFIYLIAYMISSKKGKRIKYKYFILTILFLYDFIIFILINDSIISLINKIIITIPMNIVYSNIIYSVLNNKKYNIK